VLLSSSDQARVLLALDALLSRQLPRSRNTADRLCVANKRENRGRGQLLGRPLYNTHHGEHPTLVRSDLCT
jgi:hypothetical protein